MYAGDLVVLQGVDEHGPVVALPTGGHDRQRPSLPINAWWIFVVCPPRERRIPCPVGSDSPVQDFLSFDGGPCVPLRAGGIGAALLSTVDRGTCAYGAVHSPGPVCHGNELGQHVNLYAVTGVGVVALPHGLSRAELLRQVPERNPGPVPAVDTVDDASIVLKRAVPYSSHSKAAVAQREPTAHPSTPQTVLLITYSPSLRRASPHIKERRPRPPRARSRPTPRPRRPTVCPVRPP